MTTTEFLDLITEEPSLRETAAQQRRCEYSLSQILSGHTSGSSRG